MNATRKLAPSTFLECSNIMIHASDRFGVLYSFVEGIGLFHKFSKYGKETAA